MTFKLLVEIHGNNDINYESHPYVLSSITPFQHDSMGGFYDYLCARVHNEAHLELNKDDFGGQELSHISLILGADVDDISNVTHYYLVESVEQLTALTKELKWWFDNQDLTGASCFWGRLK